MSCLAQWFRRRPQRHEEYETPVCVHATAPLMAEVVGTVSPSTVFASCCEQAGQALRLAPPAVCFGTQDVDAPAQEAMEV